MIRLHDVMLLVISGSSKSQAKDENHVADGSVYTENLHKLSIEDFILDRDRWASFNPQHTVPHQWGMSMFVSKCI